MIVNQQTEPRTAGHYLRRANQLKRAGKLEEAIALYHRVIELNPHLSWAYHNLGNALIEQGNLDRAAACYLESIKINPNSAWLYYRLGEALAQQGDLEAAIELFQKAIALKPDCYKFYDSMGWVLNQQQNFDKALKNYQKSIEINPSTTESYLGCCICCIYRGDLSSANEYITKVLKLSPRSTKGIFYHEFLKTIEKLGIRENNISDIDLPGKFDIEAGSDKYNLIRTIAKIVEEHLDKSRDKNEKKQLGFHRVHRCLSEMILPGGDYLDILKKLHSWLQPKTYVEIGIESGRSFRLSPSSTISIGIDPKPKLKEYPASAKIFALTSNDFFSQYDLISELNGNPLDLAFIDGLHLFDQSLQDFINLEKYSHQKTVICFHDTLPLDKITSQRNFSTMFWSGDVWKIVPLLKQYRPELTLFTVATKPTGLTIVTNLDPRSQVLEQNYDEIVNEYMNKNWVEDHGLRYSMLSVVSNNWNEIAKKLSIN